MEQGQLSALLLVGGLAHQGGNFRQGKDLLRQLSECRLAQPSHFRGNAFHVGPTDDKPVVSLPPLALSVVADAVLQTLALVLVLFAFDNGLVSLFLQFLA